MTAILAVAVLAQTPKANHMTLAKYPAGSLAVDTTAPGGHGTSNNYPKPIERGELKGKGLTALLLPSKHGVVVYVGNDLGESWLHAADGNLLGYLEAKNSKGEWAPIEYHPWYTCGNSYHNVQLPAGKSWAFFSPMLYGNFRTQIRWQLAGPGPDLISNEIQWDLNPERLTLPSDLAKTHFIEMGWKVPTLRPKQL
ncbi:MAG TPA: hypothetical protein PKA27_03310 [Fimbriimonadaceae bacterium]|nr:hypothetical protein [Fimbriimonadaceae bacterium]